MSEKTAAILGSTGMIGNYLLDLVLTDEYFNTVRVLVRRPVQKKIDRMEVKLVDFNDAESFKTCAGRMRHHIQLYGTTQKM
jgi:1-deoxy-D-xylulose 5-phosphate reductoisomerase